MTGSLFNGLNLALVRVRLLRPALHGLRPVNRAALGGLLEHERRGGGSDVLQRLAPRRRRRVEVAYVGSNSTI